MDWYIDKIPIIKNIKINPKNNIDNNLQYRTILV
jgi:hypothetical protein